MTDRRGMGGVLLGLLQSLPRDCGHAVLP